MSYAKRCGWILIFTIGVFVIVITINSMSQKSKLKLILKKTADIQKSRIRDVGLSTEADNNTILIGLLAFGNKWKLNSGQGEVPAIEYLIRDRFNPESFNTNANARPLKEFIADGGLSLLSLGTYIQDSHAPSDVRRCIKDLIRSHYAYSNQYNSGYLVSYTAFCDGPRVWKNYLNEEITVDDVIQQIITSLPKRETAPEFSHLLPMSMSHKHSISKNKNVSIVLDFYLKLARENQQVDGSFGVTWLKNYDPPANWTEGLYTTSKMVLWISLLPESDNKHIVVNKAVNYIIGTLQEHPQALFIKATREKQERYRVLAQAVIAINFWEKHCN